MLHWLGLHFKNLINFVCIEHASVTFTIANTEYVVKYWGCDIRKC